MSETDLFLAQLPGLAYAAILVLARVGGALMLLPLLGEADVPGTVRAGFVLILVLLLLPVLRPLLPPAPDGPLLAFGQLAAELVTGLWFGWLARLAVYALVIAGQVLSLAIGVSSVVQPDPLLGTQSSALARLMTVLAPVLLLASGLHALPLAALAGSYDVIPAGSLLPAGDTAESILRAVGESFALAIRLAAPFLAASLLWNLAVSLAGRVAAQLQPTMLVAPAQLLGGLGLLALLLSGIAMAWREHAGLVLDRLPGLH